MSKSKIKVLHIITHLPIGGAQDNTIITVERLNRSKYDITLISANEGQWVDRALAIKDLEVVFINHLKRSINLYCDLVALTKLYRHIKKNKYDIVHTHQAKAGILGRIAAWLAGVPVIIHTYHSFPFHDFMKPSVRTIFIKIEKVVSKITDKLINVSKLNLEKGVELAIAPREKFTTIYSGIDFSRFDIDINVLDIKANLGISKKDKVVGMIGRLSEQKAPQYLVDAIPKVLANCPDTTFLIVGDGDMRTQLERSINKFDINGKIKFLGYREDIPTLLHTLDIFILTSLWEGLGRSLTEAMYVGKPVICTEVEGVPELIEHDKTGLLIPIKNSDAAADSLVQLISSEDKRERLGKAARDKVKSTFEADLMVQEIHKLYQQLLTEKGLTAN